MSKNDELRAMREARHAQRQARAGTPSAIRKGPVRPTLPADSPAVPAEPELAETARCGHRSMNGRTCTREHAHAATSHRYG
jgi:hypothetical protein